MTNLEMLFEEVDKLAPSELRKLRRYIETKQRIQVYEVSPQALAQLEEVLKPVHEIVAQMSDEEIDSLIDEAIAEHRRESKED